MSTDILSQPSRRLPTVDGVALAVGALGLVLSRVPGTVWSGGVGLLGLAVFGPPALRELGLLGDEDEYSRSIRWRAGFHAVLVVAAMIFLNNVLYPLIASHPDAMARKVYFFPVVYLRMGLVLSFLISFFIQYWGAQKGVFRLLLGLAGLTFIETVMTVWLQNNARLMIGLTMLGLIGVTVGVAFLTRIKPRISGFLLLLFGAGFAIYDAYYLTRIAPATGVDMSLEMQLGLVQGAIMMILIFGSTGMSLLKAPR